MKAEYKQAFLREIRAIALIMLFALILYWDSTADKWWRYPLELKPEYKEIEYRISIYVFRFGYFVYTFIRLLVYLVRKFIVKKR